MEIFLAVMPAAAAESTPIALDALAAFELLVVPDSVTSPLVLMVLLSLIPALLALAPAAPPYKPSDVITTLTSLVLVTELVVMEAPAF